MCVDAVDGVWSVCGVCVRVEYVWTWTWVGGGGRGARNIEKMARYWPCAVFWSVWELGKACSRSLGTGMIGPRVFEVRYTFSLPNRSACVGQGTRSRRLVQNTSMARGHAQRKAGAWRGKRAPSAASLAAPGSAPLQCELLGQPPAGPAAPSAPRQPLGGCGRARRRCYIGIERHGRWARSERECGFAPAAHVSNLLHPWQRTVGRYGLPPACTDTYRL